MHFTNKEGDTLSIPLRDRVLSKGEEVAIDLKFYEGGGLDYLAGKGMEIYFNKILFLSKSKIEEILSSGKNYENAFLTEDFLLNKFANKAYVVSDICSSLYLGGRNGEPFLHSLHLFLSETNLKL
jgi:hypothetical protein